MFRIREESLHDMYKKWPTKNFKRDYVLFAKVYSNLLTDFFRMRFKKSRRITQITTSLQSGRRFPGWWAIRSTRCSERTTARPSSSSLQMCSSTHHSRARLRTSRHLREMPRLPSSSKLLTFCRDRSVSFSQTIQARWHRSRLTRSCQSGFLMRLRSHSVFRESSRPKEWGMTLSRRKQDSVPLKFSNITIWERSEWTILLRISILSSLLRPGRACSAPRDFESFIF